MVSFGVNFESFTLNTASSEKIDKAASESLFS